MRVVVDSWAWVEKRDLSPYQLEVLRRDLTVWPQKVGNFGPPDKEPDPIFLYKETEDRFGMAREYFMPRRKPHHQVELQVTDGSLWPGDAPFEGVLEPPQQEALETVLRAFRTGGKLGGVLRCPTAFGKTVLACAIAAELRVPVLVVVHREPLLEQWQSRISRFLPRARVGVVQQNVCDYRNCHLSIGMVHSLAGRQYDDAFYDHFGLLLVDETHRIGAATWAGVPPMFRARHRIGLSATPYRADKADNVFYYHLGNILFSASRLRLKPKVKRVWTTFQLIKTDRFNPSLMSRPILLRFLCASEKRNRLIVGEMVQALKAGRKLLVLSERIHHLNLLEGLLREVCAGTVPSIGYYIGNRSSEELRDAAQATVIFATAQFAREGIDIPELDTLFLATPLNDIIQPAGRILREHPHKKEPVIVDFRDDLVSYCKAMGDRRDQQYDGMT